MVNIIYIVRGIIDYEAQDVLKAFTVKEQAEVFLNDCKVNNVGHYNDYDIVESELA